MTKPAYEMAFLEVLLALSARSILVRLMLHQQAQSWHEDLGLDQRKDSGDNGSIHKLCQRSMVYLIQQTLSFGGRERQSNVDRNIKVEVVQRKKTVSWLDHV